MNHPLLPNGIIVVNGPSRGGKSRWAEHLVSNHKNVTYVATSAIRTNDQAWEQRVRLHRERRPSHWQLIESGEKLSESIQCEDINQTLLIDALGGFTATLLNLNTN